MGDNEGKSITVFLKRSIFSRSRTLRGIISDRGSNFYNNLFKTFLDKYGNKQKLKTTCHPPKSGKIEVSNQKTKSILEKIVNTNQIDLIDGCMMYFRPIKCHSRPLLVHFNIILCMDKHAPFLLNLSIRIVGIE